MRRLQIKFPNQIRISGWDFDSSARAMNQAGEKVFTQAELVKVINSTTERKSMSTKTSIKRIALVAVSALGFGLLSVVPSQAAPTGTTLTVDASDAISTGESATASVTLSYFAPVVGDSVTVTAVISGTASNTDGVGMSVSDSSTSGTYTAGNPGQLYYSGTNSSGAGGTAITSAYATTADYATTITVGTGTTAARTITSTYTALVRNVKVGGTYTVTFYAYKADGTAITSATWTVTATAVSTTATGASTLTARQYVSGQSSTSPFGGTAEGTDSTTVATKSSTRTTPDFTVWVLEKNATGTAAESVTATVTGNAYIQANTIGGSGADARNTAQSTALTVAVGATSLGTVGTPVYVYSNGTAGTATVTFTTASGLALGSKTFTFTGNVTTLAVGTTYQPRTIVRAGG